MNHDVDVLISGGGVGGLAAAVALRDQGFEVLVLERAEEGRRGDGTGLGSGAGLGISANGMRTLGYLGVDERVREVGVVNDVVNMLDLDTGERLRSLGYGAAGRARYGDDHVAVHRGDLREVLMTRLPSSALRTGVKVVDFREDDDGVVAVLEDGEEITAKLLIGADGIRSTVREKLFGAENARYSGLFGWWALIPAERVPAVFAEQAGVSSAEDIVSGYAWAGRPGSVIFHPVRNGEMFNFTAWLIAEDHLRESWTDTGDTAVLKSALSGACEEVVALVDAIDEALVSALMYRDPLTSWGSNRVTLLGDAAHPAIPFTGNGASMALEDAVTFAHLLKRRGIDDPSAAILEYGQRRIPRTTILQNFGRMNMISMNQHDPELVRARNGLFRGLDQLDPVGATMFSWIYEHDVVADLDRPVDLLVPQLPPNPRERPESRAAFEAWATALGPEDRAAGWVGERAAYERFWEQQDPASSGLDVEESEIGGVACLRVGHGDAATVLHLHGGGFVIGSARSSRGLAERISGALDAEVVIPDYRRAPEHGAPAALEDVVAVYRDLVSEGRDVVVTGEDAGGGLALSLAMLLRDSGEKAPRALYLCSPFADLSLSSPSIDENLDLWLPRPVLTHLAASYLQDADLSSARVSPLAGDLSGLPPILVHAAADESLRDDAVRIAEAAPSARLRLFDDTVHSFVLFPSLPEAHEAMDELARFVATSARAAV